MKRFAIVGSALLLLVACAFITRWEYLRFHCQETYGSNPWTGVGNRSTSECCLTPTEIRRRWDIELNERDYESVGHIVRDQCAKECQRNCQPPEVCR